MVEDGIVSMVEDPAIVDALARLAALIGDREGLADVRTLFDSLDEDGSGALDPAEFTLAMRKFGFLVSPSPRSPSAHK
jgi:hypothetical protein